jgi:hypothetical protein
MSALLFAERFEGQVLEARHFGLEEAQVHERGAVVVVTLGLLHVRASDAENRQPFPVDAAQLDAGEFAATREPKSPEEEVLGL